MNPIFAQVIIWKVFFVFSAQSNIPSIFSYRAVALLLIPNEESAEDSIPEGQTCYSRSDARKATSYSTSDVLLTHTCGTSMFSYYTKPKHQTAQCIRYRYSRKCQFELRTDNSGRSQTFSPTRVG